MCHKLRLHLRECVVVNAAIDCDVRATNVNVAATSTHCPASRAVVDDRSRCTELHKLRTTFTDQVSAASADRATTRSRTADATTT